MYKTDVPKIKRYVQEEGPDGLVSVGAFVLSTIQTPLSRTLEQVRDIKERGESSKALWGFKRAGFRHLSDNKQGLYHKLVERPLDVRSATLLLLNTPGLGLPKASFLLQCLGYNTACLDVHNLKRYNINPSITRTSKLSTDALIKKTDNYIEFVQKKGSEYYWDGWCGYVAGNRMNKSLPTAEVVSSFHYQVISV